MSNKRKEDANDQNFSAQRNDTCQLHDYMEKQDNRLEEMIERQNLRVEAIIEKSVPSKWFMYILSGLCAFAVILGGLAYRSVEAKNIQQDRAMELIQVSTVELHEEILKIVKENQASSKSKP